MSQWTHVLGVVRFDDSDRSVFPKPRVDNSVTKADIVHRIFQGDIPGGSEGDLEVQTIITDRGPTVILTGDLRNFGRGEVDEICKYLSDSVDRIKKDERLIGQVLPVPLSVRDAIVDCNVEFYGKRVTIYFDTEGETPQFKIIES